MAFSVTDLTAYVEQDGGLLLRNAILKNTILDRNIHKEYGVKSSVTLNKVSTGTPSIQTGGACAFTTSGTTTLTPVTVSTTQLSVQETLCPQTLEKYWIQKSMQPGSYIDSLPLEQVFMEERALQLSKAVNTLLFQGSTTQGTGNNLNIDGWLHKIKWTSCSASTVTSGVGTSALTSSNAIAIIDNIIEHIPTDMLSEDDIEIYVDLGAYRTIVTALKNANYFISDYQTPRPLGGFELNWPFYSNIKIVGNNGMPTTAMVCTYANNLIVGLDLMDDMEKIDVWYSKDDRNIKMSADFKLGVQIFNCAHIVYQVLS